MIYLDSCGLVKLLTPEPETIALRSYLSAHVGEHFVSSALARVEVIRAVRHQGQGAIDDAREMCGRIDLLPMTHAVLESAATAGHGVLRTLDAIHLSTALRLGLALTAMVTYDRRLADAARDAGLAVTAPGRD